MHTQIKLVWCMYSWCCDCAVSLHGHTLFGLHTDVYKESAPNLPDLGGDLHHRRPGEHAAMESMN